jgi:DNA-binding transcriptional LysR family regulator
MQRVFVAAPAYLARHGTPEHPSELDKHRVVSGPVAPHSRAWRFEQDGRTTLVEIQPALSTNDTAGALAAAVCGLGVTPTTSWACRRELQTGELVQLFPGWTSGDLPVHAYLPMGRATRLAARAFVDFIAAELRGD